MEGLNIRPVQNVYLNWILWCEAVLENFYLPYGNTLNRCATFLRVVYRDSLKKQKLYAQV